MMRPILSKSTRATLAFRQAGVDFTTHEYAYDPNAQHIGLQATEALGVSPDLVLKT